MTRVLIVPGLGNSGPDHWQSHWEAADESIERLKVDDWDRPACDSWVAAIDRQARALGESVVIAAHSLGCLAVVYWAARKHRVIQGALLVAVPDPEGPSFPSEAVGFSALPLARLSFPSIVVASSTDPYSGASFVQDCANAWGSQLVGIGPAGHINSASNLGSWPFGLQLLNSLRSSPVSRVRT